MAICICFNFINEFSFSCVHTNSELVKIINLKIRNWSSIYPSMNESHKHGIYISVRSKLNNSFKVRIHTMNDTTDRKSFSDVHQINEDYDGVINEILDFISCQLIHWKWKVLYFSLSFSFSLSVSVSFRWNSKITLGSSEIYANYVRIVLLLIIDCCLKLDSIIIRLLTYFIEKNEEKNHPNLKVIRWVFPIRKIYSRNYWITW